MGMAATSARAVPPAPRPTRRTIYGLASVADVPASRARAALERGLEAVPERDRSRICAGARAIGIEILPSPDAETQRAYRDVAPDDEDA
jgi:hypothetical protein